MKWFDQFGYPITLTINRKPTHQTHLGGFCSILCLALITFYAYLLVIRVLDWRDFAELNFEERGDTNGNYPVAFLILDGKTSKYVNSVELARYLRVSARKVVSNWAKEESSSVLAVRACKQSDFVGDLKFKEMIEDGAEMICVDN